MALDFDRKLAIIDEFKINEKDTGSVEVQVAVLSAKIRQITEHLRTHPKDYHTRVGLMKMIGRRRSFLRYLKKNKPAVYKDMIEKLGIRDKR